MQFAISSPPLFRLHHSTLRRVILNVPFKQRLHHSSLGGMALAG
jgi:hypothetical protein